MPQINHIADIDSIAQETMVYKSLVDYQLPVNDSLITNKEAITEMFIQETPVDYTIKLIQHNYADWMVYILLILTFGISLIWYYMPERAVSLFNFAEKRRDFGSRENVNTETPGTIILFFFALNYFVTISLFLALSLKSFYPLTGNMMRNEYIVYFFIAIIAFYIFRILIIFFTGFIFNTSDSASSQMKLYLNIDNIIGVLLIPVLFVMLFVQVDYVIYIGIIIIIIFHIFRWFQTFMIGKSIPGFSILHLFMYLCTLEIIPLIVIIKFMSTELI